MKDISTRPLRIFLCHASDDKTKVHSLYSKLTADGFDTWLDEENLLPGQEWQIEIPKAVQNTDVVIVCLSKKFIVKEGYGQKEIKLALDVADEKPEGTIFLIPAKLEECKVPDRLIRWQWVELFKQKGYMKLKRALNSRAIQLYSSLTQQKDKNASNLFANLKLAQKESNWPAMIRLCNQLMESNPNNAELYATRAQAHFQQGNDEKAILDSTSAIDLDSRSFLAYQIRADAHRMKRNYSQSIVDATMSIKIHPNVDAYVARIKSYMQTGKYKQAIEDSNNIIKMSPDNAFAYGTQAVAYVSLKNYPEAIKNAETAIELDPKVGGFYFASAKANFAAGNYKKAIEDASRSIELDPEYVPAYRTRANAYLKLNDTETAARDFEKAKKLGGKDGI
jgi:tetratricopeptide (TPR) repeat protein